MKKSILASILSSLLLGCGTSFQYIHPGIGESTVGSQARILREFCVGEGRGLIHFEEYNGIKTYKDLGDKVNISKYYFINKAQYMTRHFSTRLRRWTVCKSRLCGFAMQK